MRALVGLCIFLAVLLAGCGSSAAPPVSSLAPQRVEHVVAARVPLDPRLERVTGNLLAVETFLRRADSKLGSGYGLQDIQLPESASASFSDALGDTRGAAYVLERSPYRGLVSRISMLLKQSIADFKASASEGTKSPNGSRTDARRGRRLLDSASALLTVRPESHTRLAHTIAQDALRVPRTVIYPFTPKPRPVTRRPAQPQVTVVSSPRQLVGVLKAKPAPAFVSHSLKLSRPGSRRIPKGPAALTPHIIRHRIAYSASRPTPKREGPRTVAGTHPRRDAASTTFAAVSGTQTRLVSHAAAAIENIVTVDPTRTRIKLTLARIQQCGEYVTSLATGNDPLGSSRILSCISRATARVQALLTRTHRSVPASPGRRALSRAIANLEKAVLDIQIANIDDAIRRLTLARSQVRLAAPELLRTPSMP